MVKADPKTSVPVLVVNIRSQLKYTPSYRNVWIDKQKALEKMHDLKTAPAYSNDRLPRGCQVFKRLFWSFKQCRDAFIYCKPLVQIDGTFMLRRHVCPQPDLGVISNRDTEILAVIERQESQWHRTYHRYYLRHVASNYYGQFRSTSEKRQVTNMGYEISKDHFHEMLAVFLLVNKEGANYLCNIPFEQWTQAYDGGLQYGHMTSNLAECINSMLKGTHHLPIIAVVQETYFCLVAVFPKRATSYKGQMQGGHLWCAKIPDERKWSSVPLAPFKLLCDRELRRKPTGRLARLEYVTIWISEKQQTNRAFGRGYGCSGGIVVPRAGDLVMGVGRMIHLDRKMNAEVFASPIVEVFESHKAMGNGKKNSSPTVPCAIPHATAAY
ncbi:hypothetical protein PVK06_030587 [Gossypium arboreum]|uniref:Uncharacterized protein n=1 Tax=Gossypium arboreum TaxID=29729 RepID=A0ABR0NNP7_GOSAR|nr:hypothetical protein PVK06_030587 [Gossypium arboreum]